MMRTTMTLATSLHLSPFEIFEQECDEVIMLINFYLQIGDESEKSVSKHDWTQTKSAKSQKDVRIRVNDKTATGGWF